MSTSFPVFGSDGRMGESLQSSSGVSFPQATMPLPRDPAAELQARDAQFHSMALLANPALAKATDALARAKRTTTQWQDACVELSRAVALAANLAQRPSLEQEDSAHGTRAERFRLLQEQLREAREELSCAVEEQEVAQQVVNALVKAAV